MKSTDIREVTQPIKSDIGNVVGGCVTLPELPGIGFEGKSDLYPVMKELAC
jgi:hypothetical protein